MALGSLASTTNRSGIRKMKAVMTARQHGKSIFGNNPTAVWADEAEELFEKPKEYLEFNDDTCHDFFEYGISYELCSTKMSDKRVSIIDLTVQLMSEYSSITCIATAGRAIYA